jgi:small subunit ribosomal protein S19
MAKKEFSYRGKSLEQLQNLTIKELAELMPARQRRSISGGFTEQQKIFLEKLEKSKKVVKTHCRDMIVLPGMVGKSIKIHKGNDFVQILIEPEMIGHFFGELVLSRRRVEHHAPGVGATKSSGGIGAK